MDNNKKILIVDDNPRNIKIMAELLEKHENISLSFASSGEKALKGIEFDKPDLILMDVIMPGLNGYQTCIKIKKNPDFKDIPVLFITGKSEVDDVIEGFKAGGVDYIKKPFNSLEFSSRVMTHLELRELQLKLQEKVKSQTEHIISLSREVEDTQRDIIYTLGSVTESRSQEVGNHVKRVAEVSFLIAKLYGLPPEEAKLLKMASPMHDIGKAGIPDNIIGKPEKLTAKEFEIIKTHTTIGFSILQNSQRRLFKAAAIVALQHHEKWDGSGYPKKLSGKNIHIFGRITALADVFDALTHKRVYKEAWSIADSLKEIKLQRGKHFDPKLVDIFFKNINSILKIYNENIDSESPYLGETLETNKKAILSIIKNECIIFGGNPATCVAHKLRNLSILDKIKYVEKLSKTECSDFLNMHMACIVNHSNFSLNK